MKRMISGSTLSLALDGCECNDAQRAAGAIGDLERCGDNHCTGCRQLVQIDQARDAEFACSVHRTVVRERLICPASVPTVSTPTPRTSRSCARNSEHSFENAGEWAPSSCTLRNSSRLE